jgi:anti-anti-sigma regulatory factor
MIVEYTEDVIYLSGDLTQDHWNTIRTAVSLLLKRHPAGVIVDLSQIERCTPEGAETFLHALSYIEAGKARFILANAPDHVRQALANVPGVRSQLPIVNSIAQARESLNLMPADKSKPVVDSVLVSLSGLPADDDAIEMAAGIAKQRSASLVLAYLIEVPRAMPLTAPLPEQETKAKQVLANAEAASRRLNVVPRCRAERVRDIYVGLADMAESLDAQLIFVVLARAASESDDSESALNELLDRTPRELIIYRGYSQ